MDNRQSAEQFRKEVLRHSSLSPILRRYVENAQRDHALGRDLRVRSPIYAIGEQLAILRSFALGLFDPELGKVSGEAAEHIPELRAQIMDGLATAHPFLVRDEASALARQYDLPTHVVPRALMPFPAMFVTFETANHIIPDVPDARASLWDSILLAAPPSWGGTLLQCIFGSYDGYRPRVVCSRWDIFGRTYPNDVSGPLVKLLTFMQSKLPSIVDEQAPRELRRATPKEARYLPSSISVVELRSRMASDSVAEYDSPNRHHSFRWMVRGHYRAQWYPSQDAHNVIWIEPHLKGPENMPIRNLVYDVCQ